MLQCVHLFKINIYVKHIPLSLSILQVDIATGKVLDIILKFEIGQLAMITKGAQHGPSCTWCDTHPGAFDIVTVKENVSIIGTLEP